MTGTGKVEGMREAFLRSARFSLTGIRAQQLDRLLQAAQDEARAQALLVANSKIATLHEALELTWDYFGGVDHHSEDCPDYEDGGCGDCKTSKMVNAALALSRRGDR